jgi:hypothetical protein
MTEEARPEIEGDPFTRVCPQHVVPQRLYLVEEHNQNLQHGSHTQQQEWRVNDRVGQQGIQQWRERLRADYRVYDNFEGHRTE